MDFAERTPNLVYIVDDDAAVRDALSVVFELDGFEVEAFEQGDTFLSGLKQRMPNVVLMDVHMPGQSGIEILRHLNGMHFTAPVFIVSGQGDIPLAVEAIKQGAHDFIEKPFDGERVLERVHEALRIHQSRERAKSGGGVFEGSDLLTEREREVLDQITSGASNKEAGRILGISPRTIEVHRARIMDKLGAKNAADLVRIVLTGDRENA